MQIFVAGITSVEPVAGEGREKRRLERIAWLGWLVGWLLGWLVGCLVAWLGWGCSFGGLVG